MASRARPSEKKIRCRYSPSSPLGNPALQDLIDSDSSCGEGSSPAVTASTATSSSSAAATAGGCLQQQPASGEVEEEEEEILGEISHIEPSEHLRNVVPAYGSLDPAATVAGAALKGITFNFEFYGIDGILGSI